MQLDIYHYLGLKKIDAVRHEHLKDIVKNVSHSKLSNASHGVCLSTTRLAVCENTTCSSHLKMLSIYGFIDMRISKTMGAKGAHN